MVLDVAGSNPVSHPHKSLPNRNLRLPAERQRGVKVGYYHFHYPTKWGRAMPKELRKPQLTLHKGTGQGRVRLGGKDVYCGAFGTRECNSRYNEIVREWLEHRDARRVQITIDDLCLLYIEHCDVYYRKGGEPTGEADNIRRALRPLIELHGRKRAKDFTPEMLIEVRRAMIRAGYLRKPLNAHISRISCMFKRGVAHKGLPAEVWKSLTAVAGLEAGRSEAHGSTPVRPVDAGTVNDTLLFFLAL